MSEIVVPLWSKTHVYRVLQECLLLLWFRLMGLAATILLLITRNTIWSSLFKSNHVQWYGGTVVQWYSDTVVQWYGGTVIRWYSGTVIQ